MRKRALECLPLPSGGVLFIENVGNLVCPAAFDLGEACKVAVLSVTEGEDKPLKYPDMFRAARLMLLNKVDLLPYLSFDVERCIAYARQVNPEIEVMQVSATTGQGMEPWLAWVRAGVRRARQAQLSTVEGLRLRVAEEDREELRQPRRRRRGHEGRLRRRGLRPGRELHEAGRRRGRVHRGEDVRVAANRPRAPTA